MSNVLTLSWKLVLVVLGALALWWLAPSQAAPEAKVVLTAVAERETIYLGESIRIQLTIANTGDTPVRILQIPVALQTLDLDIELRGEKTGIVGRSCKRKPPAAPGPDDYDVIPQGKSQSHDLDLDVVASLRPVQPDTYSLTVLFKVDGRLLQAAPVKIIVADLPKIERLQTVSAKQDTQGGQYTAYMDVGFLSGEGDSRPLVAIRYRTEVGNDKLIADPRTIRLGSGSVKGILQAGAIAIPGVYMPADVHILVTEPNEKQFYWVLPLRSGGITRSESFPERKVRFLKSERTGNLEVEIKQ